MNPQQKKDILSTKTAGQSMSKKFFLSSGSAMVNVAISGNVEGAFSPGYHLLVGDSDTGKSYIALTSLAEAANDKFFNDYQLIYDDVEGGALMNKADHFGKKAAKRIKSPNSKDQSSFTVEEFWYNIHNAADRGPFIYLLDSMDALSSASEGKKFKEQKRAHENDKAVAGSYGDGKAKQNAAYIRQALKRIEETNSVLIIICQTRDNLGFGFETKTRSGGHALTFYATSQTWFSKLGKIKKTIKKKERQVGIRTKAHVKRSRITGKDRVVELQIFQAFGVDDLGSCVDFLIAEKHWKKSKQTIKADDIDFAGSRGSLISHIESENLEEEVYGIVQDVWDSIELAMCPKRKKRYQ